MLNLWRRVFGPKKVDPYIFHCGDPTCIYCNPELYELYVKNLSTRLREGSTPNRRES